MEIYDTEEEQVAAIKRWWKANGTSTITGVTAGIVLIVGWNFWQGYNLDKAKQASALYGQLQNSINTENKEPVEKLTAQLTELHGSTAYADFATLQLIKIKVEQGDLDAAKVLLEGLLNGSGATEIKHIARIRLIKILQATDQYEKGLQLITEVDQTSSAGFTVSYDELKGDLYVALDRLGEARTAYQSALRSGAKSPLLQFKLDDIAPATVVN